MITVDEAIMMGRKVYYEWCEQRGYIELPTNPDKYANPFLTEKQKIEEEENASN